jgi:DNA-binding response OmpR family regulator
MIHVIEDEENIRKLLAVNLMKRGHQVVEALTVEQAVKQLKYLQPDLMILNILLTDGSGLEILDHLEATQAEIFPVVVITGTMIDNPHLLSKYPRIARIYTKPFDINELISFVHDTLSYK